jgi:DnaD/phage-associated family protein
VTDDNFSGFTEKTDITPIPNILITKLIPKIDNIVEIKAILHIFWLLSRKKGYPRYVTFQDLLNDPVIIDCMPAADKYETRKTILKSALDDAVLHNIILHLKFDRDNNSEDAYFINTESDRRAIGKIQKGDLVDIGYQTGKETGQQSYPVPDIFSLYEQNIGMITPIMADELKEIEQLYPMDWIEHAVKEAVDLNKRNWRYVVRILERWATEGKDDGKSRGHNKKESDSSKYIQGKYGHMVER